LFILKMGFLPFALSLSKGRSWFDKLTTNGILHITFYDSLLGNGPSVFASFIVPFIFVITSPVHWVGGSIRSHHAWSTPILSG